MAEGSKPKRRVRPTESVRQKAEKVSTAAPKPRRIRKVASGASEGLKSVSAKGRREYHVIKLPDNRVGRFMTKSRRILPAYFRESWTELKLVTWPNRRETVKFTTAVLIFALIFGGLVALVDYGLEKLFRNILDL